MPYTKWNIKIKNHLQETDKKAIILFTRNKIYEEREIKAKFVLYTKDYFDDIRIQVKDPSQYYDIGR